MPGLVTKVFVKVHDKVATGDPLFKLDDRQLKADLEVRKAAVQSARAELLRLEGQPRKEQLPSFEAAVTEAEANLANAADEFLRRRIGAERSPRNDRTRGRQSPADVQHVKGPPGES